MPRGKRTTVLQPGVDALARIALMEGPSSWVLSP